MPKLIDLSGQRFGRLTVIGRAGHNSCGKVTWHCKCDCGNVIDTVTQTLKSGVTQSCGCLQREKASKTATKHGGKHERLYKVWLQMKNRCNNPNARGWMSYGGRGIRVCKEWQDSYESFRAWALANEYDETGERGKCTIDRIDVNGNYEPGNCRWITIQEQQNNRRSNRRITFNGETHNLKEWEKLTGIKRQNIWERLELGWPVERALTEPLHWRNSHPNKKNG